MLPRATVFLVLCCSRQKYCHVTMSNSVHIRIRIFDGIALETKVGHSEVCMDCAAPVLCRTYRATQQLHALHLPCPLFQVHAAVLEGHGETLTVHQEKHRPPACEHVGPNIPVRLGSVSLAGIGLEPSSHFSQMHVSSTSSRTTRPELHPGTSWSWHGRHSGPSACKGQGQSDARFESA